MQPFGENTSNIPAFLGKLWKMVNDPNTDSLICWSPTKNSFIIQNQAQFWYELLPLYYKHNNMSSFVRQLNMYGFHKMSTVENGTMDADKDEIQFYHKYFQKDQPELLKNIKRKVTTSKSSENNVQNVIKSDDIAKVLTDVKQLRGRQSSVDSQLSAMKQENAVLWRELAILRQKHLKQQQIVNKLIQFLVTLVQPTAGSRMGVGVKRRMPLMLHESPSKKSKTRKRNHDNDTGPTIHEIESEITPEELLEEQDIDRGIVNSPPASTASSASPKLNDSSKPPSVASNDGNAETENLLTEATFWDKPDYVPIEFLQDNDIAEENMNTLQNNTAQNKEVFLNPTARNALLTDLTNGTYNVDAVSSSKNGKKIISSNVVGSSSESNGLNKNNDNNSEMTVATRDYRINSGTLRTNDCSRDDLDVHLETTQSEIDQLRDLLHGCNTFDANTLLGLFSDGTPDYGLMPATDDYEKDTVAAMSTNTTGADPMVSGTELANVNTNLIDFNELLDDSFDGQDHTLELSQEDLDSGVLVKSESIFPVLDKDL